MALAKVGTRPTPSKNNPGGMQENVSLSDRLGWLGHGRDAAAQAIADMLMRMRGRKEAGDAVWQLL
jgi:hypothetical protein